ncbi:MAG TPA: hypothetical protein PLV68_09160, partial [Ilumatobacteraceae bacterium]|nr:hypothetical protein [Ilumatobacteraceae bacterium]
MGSLGIAISEAVAMAVAVTGVTATTVTPPVVAAPATPGVTGVMTSVVFDGHGYGHGVGMSQWGAIGYAVDQGWSAAQILGHYYGGTVASTAPDDLITVRLGKFDGAVQTALVHDLGALTVDGLAGGPWRSVAIRETAPNRYSVYARADTSVCPASADDLVAAGWTVVGADLTVVTARPATDTS